MINTIIGISGRTGSGKTTVAEEIAGNLHSDSVALIHQDSYYKDLNHLGPEEREKVKTLKMVGL